MPARKDITNQRFGLLTALYPTETRDPAGGLIWHCRCACGRETDAPLRQLTGGYKKSCGCLSHPPVKDLIGQRFGQLTVLSYEGKRAGMHRWRCRCDCGRETVVGQTLLQSGKTKSCGCRRKTVCAQNLELTEGTSVTLLKSSRDHTLKNNTSGHTGVYRHKKTGKWAAQITFKGRSYWLGIYDSQKDAVKAREKGEEMRDDFLTWYEQTHSRKEEDA